MLATDELGWILSLLEDHTIIFDVLTDRFVRKFKKTDHFRIATGIYLLLQNRVLSLGSRLNAYYLLFDLYKNESLPSNPFFPAFWLPPDNNPTIVERSFLLIILSGKATPVVSQSYTVVSKKQNSTKKISFTVELIQFFFQTLFSSLFFNL